MEKIEKVQYNAALAITGTWRGSNRSKLYEELGWESLNDRRWARRLTQFFKIYKNLSPAYLRNHLPLFRASLYGVRHPNIFRNIYCYTSRYQNSFYPNTIKLWNVLGNEFQDCKSLLTFKKYVTSLIKPEKKSIFNTHNPYGISYIFQLRVGLSPLKYHKMRHNFTDTTTEKCDCTTGNETVEHFLLKCPFFHTQRTKLITSIKSILIEKDLLYLASDVHLFLYGSPLLNVTANKKIVQSVISYIIETNRFS